jgi:hypothetical protein
LLSVICTNGAKEVAGDGDDTASLLVLLKISRAPVAREASLSRLLGTVSG